MGTLSVKMHPVRFEANWVWWAGVYRIHIIPLLSPIVEECVYHVDISVHSLATVSGRYAVY